MTGNAKAMQGIGSGKVIASGPNDHVFVYFADHGAPGLIAFPSSEVKLHLNFKIAMCVCFYTVNNIFISFVIIMCGFKVTLND